MAKKTIKMKRLTATEKAAIEKAANRATKFRTGRRLTADERGAIFDLVSALKAKGKPVVGKEAIALWSAKIDWAIANGDRPAVGKLIKMPLGPELMKATQFWDDNGGCSCGGGGTGPASW
jgi:hypothetical protein